MNNIKFLSVIAAMTALVACQQSEQFAEIKNGGKENRPNSTIEFSNYVNSQTRASKVAGNSFVAGDEMAVWGDQTTGLERDVIFNNQKVSYVEGTTWTYTNKKLWNAGSEYVFYGFFPYMNSPIYEISSPEEGRLFKVNNYVTTDNSDTQLDLMISERREVSPFNTVNMIFHHMLSKVDIIFRVSQDFDMTGISSIELVKFHIEGIKESGSYVQTEWDKFDNPVGTWTAGEKELYVEDKSGLSATDNNGVAIIDDYLMIPQVLGKNVTFDVAFRIHYQDGTTCMITKDNVILGEAIGKNKTESGIKISSWEPNNSYLYQLVFNPSKNEHGGPTSQPNGCIDRDHDDPEHPVKVDIITYDKDGDGIPDEYWVDEDRDGNPDYPLVWDDPDGDGIENLFPDKDRDGVPDGIDNDEDGNPDDLWVDTDGDGEADKEVERKKPGNPNTPIPDPTGEEGIGNGCIDKDHNDPNHPTHVDIITVDKNGDGIPDEYWVDEDRDGKPDYPLIWSDPDGDGIENLFPDKDKDGRPDFTDSDNDGWPDDLWVDTDGDGEAETEVWRKKPGDPTPIPQYLLAIEFTATVADWEKDWEAEVNISETKE